ncbi:zinc finger protein 157-like isoform X2 [Lucilia cuprina]|uniref:zinc finger protein 157-like isoform X2 n=1 Tax=Lucilia cuprina TaxID=7375 RepID=UPI001F061619|nr:zinc finger protein 157-like isoform X2 [Lucilia cuprina]
MKQRCRCCLITNSNDYYDIFEQHVSGTSYAENICFLAEVQIDQDDGLPQVICSNCYNEVQRIYEFSLNVRLADERLRQELEGAKKQMVVEEEEEQMENVQVLENEYFSSVDENGMQVCVMEEILEQENEHDNELIVEEINDVDEIHMVEEILESKEQETVDEHEHTYQQKENLLVGLAQVAATQENVNITDSQCSPNDTFYPSDENDEDYLIEYEPNEENNFVPMKWKCGECKVILRGDVSYEGHMNIHRQIRPHKCNECQSEYRCRTALKRHKELKHSLPLKNDSAAKTTQLCPLCNKEFYAKIIFHLHQAIVHDEGDKCPLQCNRTDIGNLREHLESIHEKELNLAGYNEITHHILQCFRCCQTFEELAELESHANLCRNMQKSLHFQDENSMTENKNNMKIVKVEEYSDISVQCNICRKKLLKKNLNKHMELHKRKEEENKVLNDTKPYLCAFCPRDFKSSKYLHQHEKAHHAESADVIYVCADCERQYATQYLLETHRKQAHKERDNVCNICGNAFKLRNQLVNHMKLHLEKNIPCPHCDKKYARQFDLNVHLRSHTGEQPYACHLCDKRFAIKVRLTYHLQKHYGIKHYCKECGAEFNSKQKLKAHSFKHTGMPYRCQLCDDHGFATRNTFKRHLTRVHHASISEEALNEMFQKNTGKTVNIKQIDEQNLVVSASDEDNQDVIEVLGK